MEILDGVHDVAEGRTTKESTFAVPEPFTESRFSDVPPVAELKLTTPDGKRYY